MQAQIISAWGGAENFEGATLPDPVPGPGEVLVQIAATSVNPADYKLRTRFEGNGRRTRPPPGARAPCRSAGGRRCSARAKAVLERTSRRDEVYLLGGVRGVPGCYAETIAADARLLAPKPASLTLREAAALPLVTITAWEGHRPGWR